MKTLLRSLLESGKGIWLLYAALVVFASLQSWTLQPSLNEINGRAYRHYNNFDIFKTSHAHLLDHRDLYIPYPDEHWDLFKYSPAFALLFGAIAWLPDLAGLLVWNGINAIVLLLALLRMPFLTFKQRLLAALIVAPELLTSLQTEQSNGLMAGLMIFTFIFLEKGKTGWATGCVIASGFIKIFGLAALPLFLFYPNKYRAALLGAGWTVAFLLVPLLVITPDELFAQYRSWLQVLSADHAGKIGFSVMGFLQAWFGWNPGGNLILLAGMLLLLAPWSRFSAYSQPGFRLLALSSLLVWVVIFNHMAESPTFVIAMAGLAIWYASARSGIWRTALLSLAILLVTLSPSDIFPAEIRREVFRPLVVKVIPCILVWLVIVWEMLRFPAPRSA